ncbi:M1 family metallopeptidase [Massilia antarctica]|uniref:M1 family metallopeptidase n=1 Tax=Massilia antarctica TaxID=2765360 RepID=UPI0006BB6183|nr:M1 family metallopeptidase [Massilia sp. H27-R4]MCY0911151.1 M1 family metallopeptidase [Massilia sp. H27-R4]CUI05263.1 Zn-dependent aminopeptidase [Janthinobacterium sp. CG23_2]CUU29049.1 Zn-dependent aminopeptidase [Janthinobacterium sp. CG23_2]
MIRIPVLAALFLASGIASAAEPFDDKFRQLEELLPTPSTIRNASGAPGHAYWQQRADYAIRARLDENKRAISATETVTYHNNSPDTLSYLWVQLDQNIFKPDSDARMSATVASRDSWAKARSDEDGMRFESMRSLLENPGFEGGFAIGAVKGADGKPLRYTINKTMMRIDLPQPMKPGARLSFNIDFSFNINDAKVQGGRTGYEKFDDDKNDLFEIAHWFPRMAAYYDVYGWQHKQFLGAGEFTLEFGDYDVQLTVPADHIVASTGELQNPGEVLTATQRERLKQARTSSKPVIIVTQQEAEAAEKSRAGGTRTWHYKAHNVRDFAFASSRKFIWDAQGYKKGGTDTMAMSYYPKEGNPLWEKYSTQAIIHTIEQYNKYALDYPYPAAISVNGPIGGMEYPMISFNGPRPLKDKKTGELSYSKRTKYGLIGVIIHEVGHNYFPMIVNSDERQWTWMDEGINTFIQGLAQNAWEENYPQSRGEARTIVDYMRSRNQVPIMTNSESLLQFGNNAYAKPAAALNVLRETVLGRELFDFAFREYAQRWKFKRPTPSDFFRTMEDASGTDLDWFWRGWFYTTDAVDVSVDGITEYGVNTKNPDIEKTWKKAQKDAEPVSVTTQRDKGTPRRIDAHPELKDFYNEHDDFTVTNKDRNTYSDAVEGLEDWEKALLAQGKHLYLVDFSNLGGLVTPLVLEVELKSGKKYIERIPAEVWRYSSKKITKLIVTDEPMVGLTQDPYWETADIDNSNNAWPRKITPSRLELFKTDRSKDDLMKEFNTPLRPKDAKDKAAQ